VKATFVFDGQGSSGRRACADARDGAAMFCELFHMFELTQNQRQAGDPLWAAVLNVLRLGVRTGSLEDLRAWELACAIVKERLLASVSSGGKALDADFANAPHLLSLTADVEAYNNARLSELVSSPGVLLHDITAQDQLVPEPGQPVEDIQAGDVPTSADMCGGLGAHVKLAVGARVMLRRNVHTLDGLVNGAQGSVTGFEFSHGAVSAVLVQFDDPDVGRLERARAAAARGQPEPASAPVAIARATSRFYNTRRTRELTRQQFPLALCWALTIHKTQGLSLQKAVINLGRSVFDDGQAYVALSRVRSLAGVALSSFTSASLEKVSAQVGAEYERLRAKSAVFRQEQAGADAQAAAAVAPIAAAIAAADEARMADAAAAPGAAGAPAEGDGAGAEEPLAGGGGAGQDLAAATAPAAAAGEATATTAAGVAAAVNPRSATGILLAIYQARAHAARLPPGAEAAARDSASVRWRAVQEAAQAGAAGEAPALPEAGTAQGRAARGGRTGQRGRGGGRRGGLAPQVAGQRRPRDGSEGGAEDQRPARRARAVDAPATPAAGLAAAPGAAGGGAAGGGTAGGGMRLGNLLAPSPVANVVAQLPQAPPQPQLQRRGGRAGRAHGAAAGGGRTLADGTLASPSAYNAAAVPWGNLTYDFTAWPALLECVRASPGCTHSWLYMPLIVDALLSEGRARAAFPFRRPNGWRQLVALLKNGAAEAGITAAQLQLDGDWHISAEAQEQVLDRCLGPIVSGICTQIATAYALRQAVNITALIGQAGAMQAEAAQQQLQ
jgi:hypothetical protein